MKINRYFFQNKDYVLEDYVDFSDASFDPTHIRGISNTHVKVTGTDYDDYLILNIKINSDVIGVCSYSLEDIPLKVKIDTSLTFSFLDEDEDVIHIDNPIFELDPYILGLIVSEVPLTLVKKGAKLPSSGEGYRVLSEDQYEEEQKNKVDSRWSALDNIELDDN